MTHTSGVAFAVASADECRRGHREPVADDRAQGRELIADTDGSESWTGHVALEVANEVGVDQVEDGLQAHADGDGRAETSHLERKRTREDPRAGIGAHVACSR